MDQQPNHDQDDHERQADQQASVMKTQLRKEVALWNATRDDNSARQTAEVAVPAAPRPSPRAAKAAKTSKAAARTAKQVATPKKPFSMSYDGVTDAQHIKYMIARGAR